MTAVLHRLRANARALAASLWFQLAILAAYFYILYTALGLNDVHIGILAGICTGTLLPGIADTISGKIKKRKGQATEPVVTDVMAGAAASTLPDHSTLTGAELQAVLTAALRARDEDQS
jgi:hypothetical protein